MKIFKQSIVKNAFAATHADITTGNGYLNIASMGSVYIPGSTNSGVMMSLVETAYVGIITPSTTVGNSNTFMISQVNRALGVNQNYVFSNVVVTGDTATTITTQIKNWVNAQNLAGGGKLNVTVAGTTTATITGGTGDPIWKFTNLGNATFTDTTGAMLLSATIASNTTATPTVFTASAAHGLTVGMTVTITTSDATKFVAGTYRVSSVPLSTTFTLANATTNADLAGTSTATGTITKVAQAARGTYALVVAAGTTNAPLGGDTPISTDTYATVIVDGYAPDADTITEKHSSAFRQVWYFDELGANYAAMAAQLVLELARQSSAGVVDPGVVS